MNLWWDCHTENTENTENYVFLLKTDFLSK